MNIIEWRDALLESPLNYKAKFVGLVISQFYRRGNPTYPSIRTLSKLTGLTVNPVQDGIQLLIDSNFLTRIKKRLPGDKYLSNIYTFNNVFDVSPDDTSPRDTSNDTSNDTSPRDTEIDKEVKVVEREALSNFKNKVLDEKMKKFAEDKKVFGKQLEKSWQRFLLIKGNAMIENNCSYEDFFKEWQLWILNERPEEKKDGEVKLSPQDALIGLVGALNWRRKRGLSINAQDLRLLEKYEKDNGEVTWCNITEWQAIQLKSTATHQT